MDMTVETIYFSFSKGPNFKPQRTFIPRGKFVAPQ